MTRTCEQGVQELRAFAFCVVTVNAKHTKPIRSKGSLGVKYKDDICTELCLKIWFESDWYFCNITKPGWFSVHKQPYADVLRMFFSVFQCGMVSFKKVCISRQSIFFTNY